MTSSTDSKFSKAALALLGYTLLVVLWGAWVRISHSGDGCGASWPLCQGEVIPQAPQAKTWIEFAHRMMSGLFGLVVLGLYVWARKVYPKTTTTRKFAFWSLFFTITEALLGAKLVLFGLVSNNDSFFRLFAMSLHLINSLLLVGTITLLWDSARTPSLIKRQKPPVHLQGFKTGRFMTAAVAAFFILGVTGAIAALASTLFPSSNLLKGIQEDFAQGSHFLIRLRVFHPLMGILIGGSLALIPWVSQQLANESEREFKRYSLRLSITTAIGVVFGLLTLFLLYPVWMKLTHLFLAYLIWIFLVLWLRTWVRTRDSATTPTDYH